MDSRTALNPGREIRNERGFFQVVVVHFTLLLLRLGLLLQAICVAVVSVSGYTSAAAIPTSGQHLLGWQA